MDYKVLEKIVSDTVDSGFLDAIKARADQTAVLALLDAEVQRSTSRLQRLRRYRNSLSSPMYRLIPELLSRIFLVYAEDIVGLADLKWTKLLLVCRPWYDVGISTPKLWSFVKISSQDIPKHALRYEYEVESSPDQDARDARRVEVQRARAGHCPLTVDLHLVHELSGAKKAAYLSTFWDLSYLHSLSISGQHKLIVEGMRVMAAGQHPNLTSLAIHPTDSLRADDGQSGAVSLEERLLLGVIVRERAPKLRALRIDEMPFDRASAPGLRVLTASYRRVIRVPFNLDGVINALDYSPLLEEVNITLPDTFGPDIVSPRQKVTLARLALLSLTAPAAVCARMLQILNLPPFSGIYVCIPGSSSTSDSLSMLATCLGSHAYWHAVPTVRSISVCCSVVGPNPMSSSRQLGIVGQGYLSDYRKAPPRLPASTMPPFVALHTPVAIHTETSVITNVLHAWPVHNVTQLDMRASASTSRSRWSVLFAELPALTTVIVRPEQSTAESLIAFLFTRLADGVGRVLVANVVFDAAEMQTRPHRGPPPLPASNPFPPPPPLQPSPLLPPLPPLPPLPQMLARAAGSPAVRARRTIIRALACCAEAARASVPMDTLEIINEPESAHCRILEPGVDVDWRELYKDLRVGFVYEGTLYSAEGGREGATTDSAEGS